jgi:hypothetical protein
MINIETKIWAKAKGYTLNAGFLKAFFIFILINPLLEEKQPRGSFSIRYLYKKTLWKGVP